LIEAFTRVAEKSPDVTLTLSEWLNQMGIFVSAFLKKKSVNQIQIILKIRLKFTLSTNILYFPK